MNSFQLKKQEKPTTETEINNLPDKKFKALVIRMLTELRNRIEEHSENFNKELENIKETQLEIKNTVTEMENILKGMNSRLSDTKKHISEMEERIMGITQSEQQKGKHIFKKYEPFKVLWDNIKHINIHIIGVSELEEREKRVDNGCDELTAEKFQNVKKETDTQVQEAQR